MSSDKSAGPSKELDSQSDKEILVKAKTPPKPKPSHDLTSIVKKYTAQQSEILKKDFKAGQDAMALDLKTQIAGLAQVVGALSTTMARQDVKVEALPPVSMPQILPPARPRSPLSLGNDFDLSERDNDEDYESGKEDDDEEAETLVEGVESKSFKKRIKPSSEVLRLWAQSRKVTDDYNAEDWKKTAFNPDIKTYTSHPGAKSFKAPCVDSETPPLKYKEQKEFEKKAEIMQTMVGAAGHLSSEMLISADEEVARLTQTIFEFEDQEVVIQDPRKEAAEVLAAIRGAYLVYYLVAEIGNFILCFRHCGGSLRQVNQKCD